MKLRPTMRLATAALCVLAIASPAQAWEAFRSPNPNVARGNALFSEGKTEDAVEAYTKAARELPESAGVHLNRGLALSAAGHTEEAREAFDLARRSKGAPAVRAASNYSLGRLFLDQANTSADGDDLEAAQSALHEARDAFRQSLRESPGNRDAAWNLELVQRRMVELERKKQEQEQAQADKEESEGQDKEKSEGQDGDRSEDPQQGDPDPQQSGQDAGAEQPEGAPDGGAGEPKPEPDAGAPQPPPHADGGAPAPKPPPAQPPPSDPNAAEPLPQHMRQALDSLQDGEENLQRHRARQRARGRPRRVEKDW